ncbi:hypothetical protein CAPTEDRAFT_195684 [Capitella teleta]|uniref:Uncharacterized protein n=1 Tax=Capitella teleta TaxID=283909 RepID=X1ZVD7_CAPTE|nr:hypothetical protein CAPTEDRAFT_195684 [Capitella teleta]|eukprot:ELT88398.1 hypothetical protein CAPTEDRAFT_195684 [Capitella teleta]
MDAVNDGLHVVVFLRRSCSMLVTLLLISISDILGDWCSQDTGYHTVTDNSGIPHNAYISATRDGSIWIRVGLDGKAQDWMYTHENKITTKVTLMPPETIDMIEALGYTDFCVLTDLQMDLHTYAGWHPSYVKAYYPRDRLTKLMILRKNPESQPCQVNTTLSLTSDGQALTCSGGQAHTCGYRHLPDKSQVTSNIFLEYIQLDPQGDGHKLCNSTAGAINSYTLFGSYYHVYVKMAKCKPPRGAKD